MAGFTYTLPTVNGSEDTWGTTLNANWTAIGTFLGSLDSAELAKLDGLTASTAELNILDGVTATAAELNILDGVTATAAELNHSDGVTSAIQTQLDSKAPSIGANWTVTQSGTDLKFAYNGVNRMNLDASGNLTVEGNVTAYGSA